MPKFTDARYTSWDHRCQVYILRSQISGIYPEITDVRYIFWDHSVYLSIYKGAYPPFHFFQWDSILVSIPCAWPVARWGDKMGAADQVQAPHHQAVSMYHCWQTGNTHTGLQRSQDCIPAASCHQGQWNKYIMISTSTLYYRTFTYR